MKTLFFVSFRYAHNLENLIGGDSSFLRELLPHIEQQSVSRVVVVALQYKGSPSADENGRIQIVRVPARSSKDYSLVELHSLPEIEVVKTGMEFGDRAFDFVLRNSRAGDVCVLNDFIENGDVQKLKEHSLRVIQLCHILPSQYVFEEFMKDQEVKSEKSLRRFSFWLKSVIAFYKTQIKSHKSLVAFFRFILEKKVDFVVPRVLSIPFVREYESMTYSDVVVVPTKTMRDVIISAYPAIRRSKIKVLPWGVSVPKQKNTFEDKILEIRKQYKIRESDFTLITLSRISPEKGIEFVIEALRSIEITNPEFASRLVLLVCGRPTMPSGEAYFEELKQRASSLRLSRVHFAGFVSGDLKSVHFYASDLYLLPSKYESFGLSMVEAMSHGLPVISTDTDGARDILSNEFARVVSFSSSSLVQEWAKAIQEMASNSLSQFSEKATQTSQDYSWSRLAIELLEA